MSGTPLAGPAGMVRGIDGFVAADIDGDGQVEVVIYNNNDLWTGVLKWQNGALVPVWESGTPLAGPGRGLVPGDRRVRRRRHRR